MKLNILLFLLLCSFTSFSQDESEFLPSLSLETTEAAKEVRAVYQIKSQFKKFFSKELAIVDDGLYMLQLGAVKGKPSTIQGMDTKTFQEIEFNSKVINTLTRETILETTNSVKGKGTTAKYATDDAVKSLMRDGDFRSQILKAIQTNFNATFQENCNETLTRIQTTGSVERLTRSFSMMAYFDKSTCQASALTKANLISQNLDKEVCKETIHELIITIEAGRFNHSKVLNKLLSISPDAPCAEDALALAKRVGEQIRKDSEQEKELNNYIQILVSSDEAARRQSYRRAYWNNYYRRK